MPYITTTRIYLLFLGSLVSSPQRIDACWIPGNDANSCNASCFVLPVMRLLRCCCSAPLTAYTHIPRALKDKTTGLLCWVTVACLTVTCTSPTRLYPVPSFVAAWVESNAVACALRASLS